MLHAFIPRRGIANHTARLRPIRNLHHGGHEGGDIEGVRERDGFIAGPRDSSSLTRDIEHERVGRHVGLEMRGAVVVAQEADRKPSPLQVRLP